MEPDKKHHVPASGSPPPSSVSSAASTAQHRLLHSPSHSPERRGAAAAVAAAFFSSGATIMSQPGEPRASATQTQSQSQSEMLTQNPDLTQPFGDFLMGYDDDDEIDDDEMLDEEESDEYDEFDDHDGLLSPHASSQESCPSGRRRNRRRRRRRQRPPPPPVPWGRLVPCGGVAAAGVQEGGTGGSTTVVVAEPPIDLMPRQRQRVDEEKENSGGGSGGGAATNKSSSAEPSTGAGPPRPGDVFNEYVLGRSAKCDVVVRKRNLVVPPGHRSKSPSGRDRDGRGKDGSGALSASSSSTSTSTSSSSAEQKLSEWVYSLVSNKHARIYCLQSSSITSSIASSSSYEVYVEDTSNNGTVVNGTVLRRCERRILNSGDEVCLVNPQLVRKKVRSSTMLQHIAQQYSYVFVAQQPLLPPTQPRLGMASLLASASKSRGGATTFMNSPSFVPFQAVVPSVPHHHPPPFSNFKPAVDPRAMKSHSFVPPAPRRYDGMLPSRPNNAWDGAPAAAVDDVATSSSHPDRITASSAASALSPQPNSSFSSSTSWRDTQRPNPAQLNNQRRISPRRQPTRRVEEGYDIRDLLGSGTTGEVRRAIERRTGIQRAVKIIPIRRTLAGGGGGRNSADATAALLTAEANLLRQLDHPYVVKLIDVYASPTAVCLVMELLHGGELFERIVNKGRYSEVDSRRVMRRILSAMHYLHEERHVVHRDLKPENILLRSRDSDVDIMITDFGLAKAVAGGDGLKTFCGTASYCAPEILQRRNTFMGRGRYNKQADQWSLGVILYILLSGCQPFDGDQWMATGAASPLPSSQSSDGIITFPEEFWAGVSELARDLVRRMLVVDPKKRITVPEACNHPWILIEDGDTHRHPLDDPRFPREAAKTAPHPEPSPCLNGKAKVMQEFKGKTEPKASEVDRDSVKVVEPNEYTAPIAEGLPTESKNELSDDEIFSQFSDKTDSVSTFDTCETAPFSSEANKSGRVARVVDSTNKENATTTTDIATTEMTRKRRVTTSVSSRKSPPSRSKGSQSTKKVKKASPTEPPPAANPKQKKLSAWFKQK